MSHVYENVVVPISDGVKVYQVVTNLKATAESEGRNWRKHMKKLSFWQLLMMHGKNI